MTQKKKEEETTTTQHVSLNVRMKEMMKSTMQKYRQYYTDF